MLTTLPVAEAIARACGTHHHLTRTFAQVCRAWRDAAREEECNRLDAALERVRRQHLIPFWQKQRETPFRLNSGSVSVYCDNCEARIDFRHTWWHAIDDLKRAFAFDLCSTCYESYNGSYRFVDLARGKDGPYYVCAMDRSDYGTHQLIVVPMRIPPRFRWPRTLHGVESAQLLRAAEKMYNVENGLPLSTFTFMTSFADRRCWINTETDTLQIENDLFIDQPIAELERDPSFNVLDWVPVAVSHYRGLFSSRLVLHHVVCANPSNTRFYGCRAVIVDGTWSLWSDNDTAELKRTHHTSLNEAGWNAEPDEAERVLETRIRQRAYEIWQSTQRNDDMANWLQAKREIYDGVDGSSFAAL